MEANLQTNTTNGQWHLLGNSVHHDLLPLPVVLHAILDPCRDWIAHVCWYSATGLVDVSRAV